MVYWTCRGVRLSLEKSWVVYGKSALSMYKRIAYKTNKRMVSNGGIYINKGNCR